MDTYNNTQQPQQQFVTNSSADEMNELVDNNGAAAQPMKPKFDENRYLDTRLKPDQTSRTLKIRLLPITADSTKMFAEARTHSLKVPNKVAASGFKSYICLDDPNIPGYDPNVKCPICAKSRELFNKARDYNPKDINEKVVKMTSTADELERQGNSLDADRLRREAGELTAKADPVLSKSIFKEACSLKPKKTYYVRVIDRNHEDHGVKF